ncbi:MAG TPA: hypothetical protein VFW11_23480, partial [Cyclobacteriaceae bacterium]|nr:hypothetical protein [Cyclobacteriaceae bacterium]
ITELPTATLLADDVLQPELTLTFGAENLEVSRMQCFIQGDTCVSNVMPDKDDVVVTIKGSKRLTRRRTLYTITIPDAEGDWHWYSHLWINPNVH